MSHNEEKTSVVIQLGRRAVPLLLIGGASALLGCSAGPSADTVRTDSSAASANRDGSAVQDGSSASDQGSPSDAAPAPLDAGIVVTEAGYVSCLSLPSAPAAPAAGCGCTGMTPNDASAPVACSGDVTRALENALAHYPTVKLGPGSCTVSETIVLPSGARLIGAGISVTTLSPSSTGEDGGLADRAGNPVLAVGSISATEGTQSVLIRDLTVDGQAVVANNPTIGNELTSNIYVGPSSTNVCIDTVESMRSYTAGIYIQGQCVDVESSQVHDNRGNGVYVLGTNGHGAVKYAENIYVRGNSVYGNSLAHNTPPTPDEPNGHTWDGIDFDPMTRLGTVVGNQLMENDIIFTTTTSDIESSGHIAWGNTIVHNFRTINGIEVGGHQTNFQVFGNKISGVNNSGITMGDTLLDGLVAQNDVQGTTGPAINIAMSGNFTVRPSAISLCYNQLSYAGGDAGAVTANRSGVSYLQSCANTVQGSVDYSGANQKTLIVADPCVY